MPGFDEEVPYVVALIELPEDGIKVLSNIINCDPDSVQIGQRVQLTFVDAGPEWKVPMFEPESASVTHRNRTQET
jgi:uncharacterized OB-fold protein